MHELCRLEKVYQPNSTGSLEIGMVFLRRYANRLENKIFNKFALDFSLLIAKHYKITMKHLEQPFGLKGRYYLQTDDENRVGVAYVSELHIFHRAAENIKIDVKFVSFL